MTVTVDIAEKTWAPKAKVAKTPVVASNPGRRGPARPRSARRAAAEQKVTQRQFGMMQAFLAAQRQREEQQAARTAQTAAALEMAGQPTVLVDGVLTFAGEL